jgi:hypothetical protein
MRIVCGIVAAAGVCAGSFAGAATFGIASSRFVAFTGDQPGTTRRLDVAIDNAHQDLWVSSPDGTVSRYSLTSNAVTSQASIGGDPRSIDVAPDGTSVLVGDALPVFNGTQWRGRAVSIDTATLARRDQSFLTADNGLGKIATFDVAITADHRGWATPFRVGSSGTEWTRSIDLTTNAVATQSLPGFQFGKTRYGSGAGRSADGSKAFIYQGDTSSPQIAIYTASTQTWTAISPTGWVEGIRNDGARSLAYLQTLAGSTYVFRPYLVNASFQIVAPLSIDGVYAGAEFDPTGQFFYTVNRLADRIERYSAIDGQLLDFYVPGDDLDSTGVLRLSTDGRTLAVGVGGGVRLITIPSPSAPAILLVGALSLRRRRR